jgi:hypothetical protein
MLAASDGAVAALPDVAFAAGKANALGKMMGGYFAFDQHA